MENCWQKMFIGLVMKMIGRNIDVIIRVIVIMVLVSLFIVFWVVLYGDSVGFFFILVCIVFIIIIVLFMMILMVRISVKRVIRLMDMLERLIKKKVLISEIGIVRMGMRVDCQLFRKINIISVIKKKVFWMVCMICLMEVFRNWEILQLYL